MTSIFLVCNIFFCGSAGGRARRRIFEFSDPCSGWFSSFCDSRNTGFYSVFLFSACLTASFKTSKNLVNYAALCYGVNENIVNTSVFWRWLKNTVNYSVFGHLTLKNHGICSGFCFSPRKNTVNNSNFAVFSCFSLFFELRWSAIHGYQILRVFFPTISTFGCFWSQWPTSLAVTSGCPTMRCGRLPSRSDVNILQFYQIIVPIISIIYICIYIYILCISNMKSTQCTCRIKWNDRNEQQEETMDNHDKSAKHRELLWNTYHPWIIMEFLHSPLTYYDDLWWI